MALRDSLDIFALAGGSSARSMYSHASIRSTIFLGSVGIPLPRAMSVTGLDIFDSAVAKDRAAELGGVLPVAAVLSCVIVLMLVGNCVSGSASRIIIAW